MAHTSHRHRLPTIGPTPIHTSGTNKLVSKCPRGLTNSSAQYFPPFHAIPIPVITAYAGHCQAKSAAIKAGQLTHIPHHPVASSHPLSKSSITNSLTRGFSIAPS